ncbi:MAG: hypothetical protein ACR2IE_00795 [Candidatus Sumerlaeaceae bacterium]
MLHAKRKITCSQFSPSYIMQLESMHNLSPQKPTLGMLGELFKGKWGGNWNATLGTGLTPTSLLGALASLFGFNWLSRFFGGPC